jgi:hypothetical protein
MRWSVQRTAEFLSETVESAAIRSAKVEPFVKHLYHFSLSYFSSRGRTSDLGKPNISSTTDLSFHTQSEEIVILSPTDIQSSWIQFDDQRPLTMWDFNGMFQFPNQTIVRPIEPDGL